MWLWRSWWLRFIWICWWLWWSWWSWFGVSYCLTQFVLLKWFTLWSIINTIINFVSIILPQTFWFHWKIIIIFQQIIHWHEFIKILCIVYQFVVIAWPKWCIMFKPNIFLCFIIFMYSSSSIVLYTTISAAL